MATPNAVSRRPKSKRPAKPPITNWFRQWLEVKDEGVVLGERQTELRDRLIEAVDQYGQPDDRGNVFYDLPDKIEFKDHEGKVKIFASLKRERHLRPANPTPDPEKTEAFLRKQELWLTEEQEKGLRDLQLANQFVSISVEVDVDAVAQAYFKGIINERQYDALLTEQVESFQFRPAE